jgi:hypothetical protein
VRPIRIGYHINILSASLLFCLSLTIPAVPLLAADAGASLQSSQTDLDKQPFLLAGAKPSSKSSPQTDLDQDPLLLQGYFSGKYVFRKTRVGDEPIRDEDVYSELRVDLSKPLSNRYEFHFYGTARDDMSSNRNRGDYSPFEDIGDASRHRAQGYLYEAHLDLNSPFSWMTQFRIGRQDGTRGEPVFFDGLAFDIRITQKLSMTAYGGAAVDYYEIDSRWGEDRLGGLGLDYIPLSSTAISMDVLYVDDKQHLYSVSTLHDTLTSARIIQRFSPYVKATLKGRRINDDPRDISVRIMATAPETGLEITGTYFRQFRIQNELSNELSPYYDILGQSNPYQTYDVRGRMLLGARVALDLGYFQRSLVHDVEETAFNRTYRRSYAVLDISDLIVNGFSASLTGEQWKTGDKRFSSGGIDAGYAVKRGRRSPKINIGSYYSLYKYDSFVSLGERTRVRTDYVKFEYPIGQRYAVSGAYEFERGIEEYQTAKLGIRYEF